VYALEEEEAASLGRLSRRVMNAQREALGAEHVYAFAIGDQVHHCHLHLVPRFADTPAHLRGTKCFDAAPEEHLREDVLADAARMIATALTRG